MHEIIMVPGGPLMLSGTDVKVTRGGCQNDNQTAYAEHDYG